MSYRYATAKMDGPEKNETNMTLWWISGCFALTVLLSGFYIYGNTGEVATYANLKKEISTQAETVYGLSVSNETASVLASIAQEVVGNDSFDSATSAPSIESADKVYVFQVSSNGAAKLLVSELDFKEPEPAGGALETPDSEK